MSNKPYDVYFSVYGKKLKRTVFAENEEKAKDDVFKNIKFYKVEPNKSDLDLLFQNMEDFIKAFSK